MWFLDRSNVGTNDGKIKFIDGKLLRVPKRVHQAGSRDGASRPSTWTHKPGTGKNADFCPSLHGGKNWPPIAFSPKTRMIYVPVNNNLCGSGTGVEVEYSAGRSYTGNQGGPGAAAPGSDHFGEVQAWNVDTGKKVWTHNYPKSPNWGAMMATAGGLVFTGAQPTTVTSTYLRRQ